MSNPADPTATPAARVTRAGADWLASASCFPRSVHALWALRPGAPSVLPCGTAFDVMSTTVLPGRRLLERLWSAGPGSGPVALHNGRLLLFAAPGTADRLPALLGWEEWQRGRSGAESDGARNGSGAPRAETIPLPLCHGRGDAVTIPPLRPDAASPSTSRWVVAPDLRHPWLPGPEMLLWAWVREGRASRAGRGGKGQPISIFAFSAPPAKVYDVSRRR